MLFAGANRVSRCCLRRIKERQISRTHPSHRRPCRRGIALVSQRQMQSFVVERIHRLLRNRRGHCSKQRMVPDRQTHADYTAGNHIVFVLSVAQFSLQTVLPKLGNGLLEETLNIIHPTDVCHRTA